MSTTLATNRYWEAFRNFHVDANLEKPVGATELRTVIADLLDKITPAAIAS